MDRKDRRHPGGQSPQPFTGQPDHQCRVRVRVRVVPAEGVLSVVMPLPFFHLNG